jgi:hypothetical protein
MDNQQALILSATVDRLAFIKAQIADLQLEEAKCDSGVSSAESNVHRATVVECAGKETINWAKIAQHFNPSRQLIRAHSSTGEKFFQIRVYARKTST